MVYAAYLLQNDDSYRDLELTTEADSPREAAQHVFDKLGAADIHPDEQFPQLIVVPDEHVHVFTRDDDGRAVTTTEDMARMIAKGPRYATLFVTEGSGGES